MTLLDQIQTDVSALLAASPNLPGGAVIMARTPNDLENDIEAALAQVGLAVFVMRPEPLEALYPAPMIFYPKVELRVRVIEIPATNTTGVDAWEARYAVANTLHGWQPDKPGVPEPLYTAPRPFHTIDNPARRTVDAIFHFPSHLNP